MAANVHSLPQSATVAISRLQAYANLNVTGVLDENTQWLMRARRCGLPDVDRRYSNGSPLETMKRENKRTRRSTNNIWKNVKRISWQWDVRGSVDLYRLSGLAVPYVLGDLRKAFDTWANGTGTKFVWTPDTAAGDIRVKFARHDHGCGYKFDGNDGVLAHAFYPNNYEDDESSSAGDIHFDSDEIWLAGSENSDPDGRGVSLFHVALHEIGHAVGLKHNGDSSSVMSPWYSNVLVNPNAPRLPAIDAYAFYELYADQLYDNNINNNETDINITTTTITTTTKAFTTTSAIDGDTGKNTLVNRRGCGVPYGPYDDITYIGDEMFTLKNGKVSRWYGGRPVGDGELISLYEYFEDIPKDSVVRAFHYDNHIRSIFIILDDELYVYKMYTGAPRPLLYYRLSVSNDLGVFFVEQVDTLFRWRDTETYLFTGRYYWKLDTARMTARYMGRIGERWPGMLDGGYDAVFSRHDRTYFVKTNWFWEVDTSTGRPIAYKQVIGNILPRCQKVQTANAVRHLLRSHTVGNSGSTVNKSVLSERCSRILFIAVCVTLLQL